MLALLLTLLACPATTPDFAAAAVFTPVTDTGIVPVPDPVPPT